MSFQLKKFCAVSVVAALSAVTLAACGQAGTESTTSTSSTVALAKGKGLCDLVKNKKDKRKCNKAGKKIEKGFNDAYDSVAKAADDATDWVDETSQTVAKKVTKAYRNAEGQIIDAANQLVDFLPLTWPEITDALEKEVGETIRTQFYKALDEIKSLDLVDQVTKYANCVNAATTSSAQLVSYTTGDSAVKSTYKDPSGCALPATLTKTQVLKSLNDTLAAITWGLKPFLPLIAWVPIAKLTSEVKSGWWTEDEKKANINITLDFFGLKKYEFGLACVQFSNDGYSASAVSLNGGCNNPWGLETVYADVVKFVKKKSGQAEDVANALAKCVQIKMTDTKVAGVSTYTINENCPDKVKDQIKSILKEVSKYQNPRNAPVLAIKSPINMVLALPPLGVQLATKSFLADMEGFFPFASWLVPSIQSVIARSTEDQWKNGQINLATGISYAGQAIYTSDIACITFGTSWDQAPSISAEGGCDRKWGVEVGGVTVYEEKD